MTITQNVNWRKSKSGIWSLFSNWLNNIIRESLYRCILCPKFLGQLTDWWISFRLYCKWHGNVFEALLEIPASFSCFQSTCDGCYFLCPYPFAGSLEQKWRQIARQKGKFYLFIFLSSMGFFSMYKSFRRCAGHVIIIFFLR